jgi:hypothetical protein
MMLPEKTLWHTDEVPEGELGKTPQEGATHVPE